MNQTELIAAVAKETNMTQKDVKDVGDAFKDEITKALKKGDKVALPGFGSFEVIKKAAREGRNPATGETIKIKASKAPKFKAGKQLKESVQ